MAFFVGGQLMLAAVVVPVLRGGDREALRAAARRFGWGSLIALAVLAATGSAMAGHFSDWGRGLLHAKLALVGLAILLVVVHMRRPPLSVPGPPLPRLRAAADVERFADGVEDVAVAAGGEDVDLQLDGGEVEARLEVAHRAPRRDRVGECGPRAAVDIAAGMEVA